MTLTPEQCPQCGGALEQTQGQVAVQCRFCGTELTRRLSAIESTKQALERRAAVEPLMHALMNRYADHLGHGRKAEALIFYEPFQYLVLFTAYDVQDLAELEAMATPMLEETARQIGTSYVPPAEREIRVTFAYVRELLAAPQT